MIKVFPILILVFILSSCTSSKGVNNQTNLRKDPIEGFVKREVRLDENFKQYDYRIKTTNFNEEKNVEASYALYQIRAYKNNKDFIKFFLITVGSDTIVNFAKLDDEIINQSKYDATMSRFRKHPILRNYTRLYSIPRIDEGVYLKYNEVTNNYYNR